KRDATGDWLAYVGIVGRSGGEQPIRIPVTFIGTAQVELPDVTLQVTRVHEINGSVAVVINAGWNGQAVVRLGIRLDLGDQVARFKVDDEQRGRLVNAVDP